MKETLGTCDNLEVAVASIPTTERLGAIGMMDGIDYFAAQEPKSGSGSNQGNNTSSSTAPTPKTPYIPRTGGGTGRSI